jgi:acyl carrier protein phosphodiesterase
MNYLAHFYLARPDPDLTFGNYIGDGVKGSDLKMYSEAVQRGIRFHRFIDSFTDSHEVVLDAKKIFYPSQAKFSGVVTDVLFDHFLAVNWDQYSKQNLQDFAKGCYRAVNEHPKAMPIRSVRFYQYMTSNNILEGYSTLIGIQRVFEGMDSRTKYQSNMSEAVVNLENHFDELTQLFHAFFPDLKNSCEHWKSEH